MIPFKRVNLVAGKGGVGKTTFAREAALQLAKSGKKVLLGELEDESGWRSALARPFGRDSFRTEPELLENNLYGIQFSASVGQQKFLSSVLRIPGLATAVMATPGIRWFLEGAPAFREMGWFYHILSEILKDYDAIVLDMPATGHFVGLANLPKLLLGMIPAGPIAEKLREGQKIIYDPKTSGAWIVTLPEELPVTEALELKDALTDAQVPVIGIVVNRFSDFSIPENLGAAKTSVLLQDARQQIDAVQRLKSRVTGLPLFALPEQVGQESLLQQTRSL